MNTIVRVPIKEELKKNPELKEEDLQHLRDWCAKQPHYPKAIDDHFLILFLHSNYYRIEPTKTTIENYLTCRTHVPEFFSNRNPLGSKEIRSIMDTLTVFPLDQTTPEGYGLMLSRLRNLDPDRFIFYDVMRWYNMVQDIWETQSGTMKGHILVCDMAGVQMSHALRINPIGVKKYLFYLQEALPVRLKGLHFINTTSVMDFILSLMKPFMKKELMSMLFLHPTMDTVKEHFPLDILPNELGGKAGTYEELREKTIKNIEEHKDFFIEEEETMRINETLRPGKAKSATDLFGIEGSFKKLDID